MTRMQNTVCCVLLLAGSCLAQGTKVDLATQTKGTLPAGSVPTPSGSTLGGVKSIDCTGVPGHILKIDTTGTPTCSADSGFANPLTTLGDVLYGGSAGAPTRLAGDTSNTRKFLSTLSATGVAAAPSWAQPAYSDISGTPQLAQTLASGSHQWLNSYNASTGLFTQTQPAFTDVSGSVAAGQMPALSGDTTSTAGTTTTTTGKVNGVTYPSAPAANTVPVVTSALSGGTTTYETVPNAALANSSVTVPVTAPLGGGGAVALGASAISITCTTCTTNAAALTSGQIVTGAGGQATQVGNLSGDISTSGSTVTTLPNIVSASAQTKITYNAKGQVTAGAQAQFSDLGGAIADGQLPNGTSNYWLLDRLAGTGGSDWAAQLATGLANLGGNVGTLDGSRFTTTQSCASQTVNLNVAGMRLIVPPVLMTGACYTVGANNITVQCYQPGACIQQASASSQTVIKAAGAGNFTNQLLVSDAVDGDQPPLLNLTAANYASVAAVKGTYVKICDQNTDAHCQVARVKDLSTTSSFTNLVLTTNVVTFTGANSFYAGENFLVGGIPIGNAFAFLNGQTLNVITTGLSGSQYEATFTHADVTSAAATGHAIPAYIGCAGTALQLTANVVTFTCTNNLKVGQVISIADLSNVNSDNFLNGQSASVASATSASFTIAFTHANLAATTDNYSIFSTGTYVLDGPLYDSFYVTAGAQVRRLGVLSGVNFINLTADCNFQPSAVGIAFNFVVDSGLNGDTAANCASDTGGSTNTGQGVTVADGYGNYVNQPHVTKSGSIAGAGLDIIRQTEFHIFDGISQGQGVGGFLFNVSQSHGGYVDGMFVDGGNYTGRVCKLYRATHNSFTDLWCIRGGFDGLTNNGLKMERTSSWNIFEAFHDKDNFGNGVLHSEVSSHDVYKGVDIQNNQADQFSTIVDATRMAAPTALTVTITKQNCPGATCQATLVRSTGNYAQDANSHYDNHGLIAYLKGFTNSATNYDTGSASFKITSIGTTTTLGDTEVLADPGNVITAEGPTASTQQYALGPDDYLTIDGGYVGNDRITGGQTFLVDGTGWIIAHLHLNDDRGAAVGGIKFIATSTTSNGGPAINLNPGASYAFWNQNPHIHDDIFGGYSAGNDIVLNTANTQVGGADIHDNTLAGGITRGGLSTNRIHDNIGDTGNDFTGDMTASMSSLSNGAVVTVVGKVNGVTYPAAPAVNTVPVVTSASSGGTVTYEAVPNAALANSSVTVPVTAPLGGGGAVALGASASSITCATCATTTNGGALSGTAPVTVSAAGAIALAAQATDTVLAGPSAYGAASAAPTARALDPRDLPSGALGCAVLDTAICSSAVDANGRPNFLSGSGAVITVNGGTTALTYYVGGVYQVINSNIAVTCPTPAAITEYFISVKADTANANPVAGDLFCTSAIPFTQKVAPTCPSPGTALSSTNPSIWWNLAKNETDTCTSNGGAYSKAASPIILLGVAVITTGPVTSDVLAEPYRLNPQTRFQMFGNGGAGALALLSGTTTKDGVQQYQSVMLNGATLNHTAQTTAIDTPGLYLFSQTPIIIDNTSTITAVGKGSGSKAGATGAGSNGNSGGIATGGGGGGGGGTSNAGGAGGNRFPYGGTATSGGGTAGIAGSGVGTAGTAADTGSGHVQTADCRYVVLTFAPSGGAGGGDGTATGGASGAGGGAICIQAPGVLLASGSTVSVGGGNGAAGSGGNTGGGGGGGGGTIIINASNLQIAGTVSAAAGTHGNATGTGGAGGDGGTGITQQNELW